MINLYDTATQELIGQITEAQLEFLMRNFEEESLEDQDYYINAVTLDMLAADGADDDLLAVLKSGMAANDELEFRWSRQ